MTAEFEQKMRARFHENAFSLHNHMRLGRIDDDQAEIFLDIHPDTLNTYGMVHGGALYTLADNTGGYAIHTDGRTYVTQSGTLSFLENRISGTIRASARVRRRGKKTALVDVDIFDEAGVLLATGPFTYFCLKEPPKGEH